MRNAHRADVPGAQGAYDCASMRSPFDLTDAALLAAYLLTAALGTWTSCLLFHDGAVYLTAAWLGDAWGLLYGQFPMRAVSTLVEFGPVWALHGVLPLSSDVFILAGHVLYFAGPLVLWLILRAVEPHRIFSRLYLAVTLAMVYFISEMIAGIGLWLIWLALLSDPARSPRARMAATLLITPLLVFTHPAIGLSSLTVAFVGAVLLLFGRPFPHHLAIATGLMGAVLLAAYLATAATFGPTNPTITVQFKAHRFDYVNPAWMLATLALFPMLAALWLLLLAPGLKSTNLRWRLAPLAVLIVAAIGLWFAANGTGLLTYIYTRHTAGPALAVALTLALASPAAIWLAEARRPLMLFAAITATAAASYNYDLLLYGRALERSLKPGVVDVDGPQAGAQPVWKTHSSNIRIYFKWAAGTDYVRDVVVPDYGRYRLGLALQSFFRSGRQSVMFHRIPETEWVPFECAPVDRALLGARDELDRRFLAFLSEHYCVRRAAP
jgi:hypothetical protein